MSGVPPLGHPLRLCQTICEAAPRGATRTMLQWRSKALTRPSSFLLLRTLISTCEPSMTAAFRSDSGPVEKSSAEGPAAGAPPGVGVPVPPATSTSTTP